VFHLLIKTTRIYTYLEGLNSSLAQSAAELRLNKDLPNMGKSYFSDFCQNFRFLAIPFEPKNVRWPIKGCKDSYYSVVSNKNLSQKSAGWVGAHGPMK